MHIVEFKNRELPLGCFHPCRHCLGSGFEIRDDCSEILYFSKKLLGLGGTPLREADFGERMIRNPLGIGRSLLHFGTECGESLQFLLRDLCGIPQSLKVHKIGCAARGKVADAIIGAQPPTRLRVQHTHIFIELVP